METRGAQTPGLLVLTAGLSKPFRRLDKYQGLLQEVLRHLSETDSDRGDTQRAIHVYKELAVITIFFIICNCKLFCYALIRHTAAV
jgi:Rho guanine nucleotide exchange factor 7